MASGKRVLLALGTNTLFSLTDAQIARYDYVITQWDRAFRIAGVKALNPNVKFILYMEGFMVNAIGSSGVTKAQADANPGWYLRGGSTFAPVNSTPLDTFNRANENPLAGGWSTTNSDGNATSMQILSNQLATISGAKEAMWNTAFPAAQEAYFTIPVLSGGGFDLSVRMHNLGASKRGYMLEAGGSNFQFYRFDNGVANTVGGTFGSAAASGDTYYIRCQGSTFEFWRNRASTWSQMAVRIDSTYNVSGKISCAIWNTTARADDFGGGDISGVGQSATYPIQSTAFPGNYLCDMSNAGFQSQWASNVLAALQTYSWDGVFIDDCNISYLPQYSGDIQDPNNYAVYLNDTSFTANTRNFLANALTSIKGAGFLVIPNIQNGASLTTFADWIALNDGSIREFWKKYGSGDSTGTTTQDPPVGYSRFATATFNSDQAYFAAANTAGKILLAITYGPLTDIVMQKYGYAAFLLDWDGTKADGYAWSEASLTTDTYTKYWTNNVGTPTIAKYNVQANANLWQRDYTEGVVILNSSLSSATFDMSSYPPLKDLTGNLVPTNVIVAAGTAEILLTQRQITKAPSVSKRLGAF